MYVHNIHIYTCMYIHIYTALKAFCYLAQHGHIPCGVNPRTVYLTIYPNLYLYLHICLYMHIYIYYIYIYIVSIAVCYLPQHGHVLGRHILLRRLKVDYTGGKLISHYLSTLTSIYLHIHIYTCMYIHIYTALKAFCYLAQHGNIPCGVNPRTVYLG